MLIYFLISSGMEIIIAGSVHRHARNYKKLQAVVLAVRPRAKELNREKKKKKRNKLIAEALARRSQRCRFSSLGMF